MEQRLELIVVIAVDQHDVPGPLLAAVDLLVAQPFARRRRRPSTTQDVHPDRPSCRSRSSRPLLESVGEDDPGGGFDEGEVGEGLREVAEVAGAFDFEFFCVEPEG